MLNGVTGLDELQIMRDHLRLKHGARLTMDQALDLREHWERHGFREGEGPG